MYMCVCVFKRTVSLAASNGNAITQRAVSANLSGPASLPGGCHWVNVFIEPRPLTEFNAHIYFI